MKIYVDSEFRCYPTNPEGNLREFSDSFFDDKCPAFIEGYRFIPSGETWERSDGKVFKGKMITIWKPYDELDAAQREYERQIVKDYNAIIQELGVEI